MKKTKIQLCIDTLKKLKQYQMLEHFQNISEKKQILLADDILSLNKEVFFNQQEQLLSSATALDNQIKPLKNIHHYGKIKYKKAGIEKIKQGKTACIILAGGQGSRLKCVSSKGFIQVSLIKNKTLFCLLSEKVKSASEKFGIPLQIAFMTSHLNHDQVLSYFDENNYFGLSKNQVSFFCQEKLPFLDSAGNLCLESDHKLAFGPNGNGNIFKSFDKSGLLSKWESLGIEIINVIPIDNPLALPFDEELFGYHAINDNDVTIKAGKRKTATEDIGLVVVTNENKIKIIEYSEVDSSLKEKKDNKSFLFQIANFGLYSFSLSFIKKTLLFSFPIHKHKKTVSIWNTNQKAAIMPSYPNVWKFEEFIFDCFSNAEKFSVVICKRDHCFAPLKHANGVNSLPEVRKALLKFEKKMFRKLSGIEIEKNAIVELSSDFYYPKNNLKEKWIGKELPGELFINGYL